MIEYRVECLVHYKQAQEWEAFFIEHHLQDILDTGCFTGYRFTKDTEAEGNSVKFVSSYYCESFDILEKYQETHSAKLKEDVASRFEGKFTATRSILHVIKESA